MNEPNWTDYLEAISTAVAAIFAVFGVYFAWRSIKKDFSNQQDQLNHIYSLTDALSKQTATLKESVKIDSHILSNLTDLIAGSSDISNEQKERYRLDIRPYFVFSSSFGGYLHDTKLNFKNDGEDIAIIRNITLLENVHGFILKELPKPGDRIKKNEKIVIGLARGSYNGGWNEVECKFEISFTDKTENNEYRQFINYDHARVRVGSVENVISK